MPHVDGVSGRFKSIVKHTILVLGKMVSCANKSSAVAEMGDRLATIDMGRKLGGSAPFLVGELGSHLTQGRLGRGLPPHQVAS